MTYEIVEKTNDHSGQIKNMCNAMYLLRIFLKKEITSFLHQMAYLALEMPNV